MARMEPPGLPSPLLDERDDAIDNTAESRWDTLAETAIELEWHSYRYASRVRLRWIRYSIVHWCCSRPMRIGQGEEQPKSRTFGWQRISRVACCWKCGRIKYVI